ncbi:unnamed protein product [Cyclocybe aegerita]|uniref:DUF6534 domain-containing protein n=1 Tax=Cyclocybe aegerita TaxID=1973307 RepID=A0A8S0VWX7_CYCAE|nr:unnamed protein product [Cyclocybe aegerita]
MFTMLGEQLSARASPAEALHGWMFIGLCFDVLLLGVMTTQVYGYYAAYSKKDKVWLQIFVWHPVFIAFSPAASFFTSLIVSNQVAALYTTLTLSVTFLFIYLYRVLIPFFGDAEMLTSPYWVLATQPAVTGLVTLSVQLFFSWRVYALTKSKLTGGFVAALALTSGGKNFRHPASRTPNSYSAYPPRSSSKEPSLSGWPLPLLATLRLQASWCFICEDLYASFPFTGDLFTVRNRHKSGFPRSDLMVKRIIRVTMQTGLVTMVVAAGDMILFLSDPSGKHLMLGGALGGLYATSLMTSLNSRKGWKFGESENTDSGVLGSLSVNRDPRVTSMKPNTFIDTRTHPEVFVHVESHQLHDVRSPGSSSSKDKARSFGPESDVE